MGVRKGGNYNMKLIFLDIDGVLNSHTSIEEYYHLGINRPDELFGTNSVDALKQIVKETGAKIVISSTWGLTSKTIRAFHRNNLDLNWIVGEIPYLESGRGYTIKEFLTNERWKLEEDIESFVIIDDEDDMEPYMNRLCKVNYLIGLTDKDAEKIIQMLTEDPDD